MKKIISLSLALLLSLAVCGALGANGAAASASVDAPVATEAPAATAEPAVTSKNMVELAASGELFKVNDHDYQIEKKTMPLYLGSSDEEDTSEIEVAFMDGITDVPYISVETMKDLISKLLESYYEMNGGKNYDLEIKKDDDTVLLTRETQYPAKIDFANDTIRFYDFDAFLRISEDAPLMDVISQTGFNDKGEAHLFQKSDTSFERYGSPASAGSAHPDCPWRL